MAENTITQVLARRRTVREFTDGSIGTEALEKLLWAAQGITGAEGKRTSPSAHGVHPLRLFVVANRVDGLSKGLYEIDRAGLSLENVNRSDLSPALRSAAIGAPPWITKAACIVAICADMDGPNRAFADQNVDFRFGLALCFRRIVTHGPVPTLCASAETWPLRVGQPPMEKPSSLGSHLTEIQQPGPVQHSSSTV